MIKPELPKFSWSDGRFRSFCYQVLLVLGIVVISSLLWSNLQSNLAKQNIASGFDFLNQEAGFDIGESLISYDSFSSYSHALWVGVLNTLQVAVVGNLLALVLGTILGVLSLTKNWLLSKLCRSYVELIRNIPLLLQLFFWYALFTEFFPTVRESEPWLGLLHITNRGLYFPWPEAGRGWNFLLLGLSIGLISFPALSWWGKKQLEEKGKVIATFWWSLGLVIFLPLLGWLFGGAPTEFTSPVLRGFNFRGGASFTPEFIALLLGLVLYTAAFNAEIVRSGILSVRKGQWEAARSLGLKEGHVMRLIILPQSLRVIIPPMTSQILNLTKNSSLAVAIGYPDFVSIANTSLNQTGQAVELIGLIMVVYLIFSLSTSLFMNFYNKRIELKGGRR